MRWDASRGTSTGWSPAVSNIMPEPGRHGWAELLALVDAIRRIAYHGMDDPAGQMREIRDLFHDFDHPHADDDA
jgi:hypothetical protein